MNNLLPCFHIMVYIVEFEVFFLTGTISLIALPYSVC